MSVFEGLLFGVVLLALYYCRETARVARVAAATQRAILMDMQKALQDALRESQALTTASMGAALGEVSKTEGLVREWFRGFRMMLEAIVTNREARSAPERPTTSADEPPLTLRCDRCARAAIAENDELPHDWEVNHGFSLCERCTPLLLRFIAGEAVGALAAAPDGERSDT